MAFIEHSRVDVPMLLHAYEQARAQLACAAASLAIIERLGGYANDMGKIRNIAKEAREQADRFLQPQPPDQPKPTAD